MAYEHERASEKVEEAKALGQEFMEMHSTLDCNTIILKELMQGRHKGCSEEGTAYMARRVQELDGQRTRDGYQQHELWTKLRQEVWAVHHPDEPLPEHAGGECALPDALLLLGGADDFNNQAYI